MPLKAEGNGKGKAFFVWSFIRGSGANSGSNYNMAASFIIQHFLIVKFCSRSNDVCCVEEHVPEMAEGKHSNWGTIFFALGFTVMMTLDVALVSVCVENMKKCKKCYCINSSIVLQ